MTLEEYKQYIKGKKVAVVGIGVSNMPLIDFLLSCGAQVFACDKNENIGENEDLLRSKGVALKLGEAYLENLDAEIIFKTPGMRPDNPALVSAGKNGAEITSEMELFFELCPCKKIAVTGSDGKTTTTTLIYNILTQAGYTCHLGGNIGRPLIGDIEKIKPDDFAVVELSSFQLFSMKKSPEIAVVTNVSPNHLDWHTNYDEYILAKKNVFAFQEESGLLVVNHDNHDAFSMMEERKGAGRFFSRKMKTKNGVFSENGEIYMCDGEKTVHIMDETDIRIPGKHNVENYLAAIAAVYDYVSPEDIVFVAKNFGGVEHRIEFVRELKGIKFYNDSIASSPTRTIAALNSFDKKLVLIAGGYDKKIPFDILGEYINEKVKELVLVGHTSQKIKEAVVAAGNSTKITLCDEFEQAVISAYNKAEPGDVVLFSPACASFDMFKNFMERGKAFKNIVNNI